MNGSGDSKEKISENSSSIDSSTEKDYNTEHEGNNVV